MALNESVISAGTSINVGQLYVANSGVNGTFVPVVNQGRPRPAPSPARSAAP